MTIYDLIEKLKDRLNEEVAKGIMWKIVSAINQYLKKGVHQNDTHGNNILIHPETMQIKVVDFGNALLDKETRELPF